MEENKKICKGCNEPFTPRFKHHELCDDCYQKLPHRRCALCNRIIDDLPQHQEYCGDCYFREIYVPKN